MTSRVVISLAIFLLSLSTICADTLIQVVREDKGTPVRGARVLIETADKTPIDAGVTNDKGFFVSKNLPGNHTKVSVTFYAPEGSGLKGIAKDFSVGVNVKEIRIHLKRKLR